MRRYRWMWGLAGAAVLAVAAVVQLSEPSRVARAETGSSKVAHAPSVVMLTGIPGDTRTEVVEVAPTQGTSSSIGAVEHIPEGDCWTLGPYEFRLSRSQVAYRGAPPRRVELRSLFQTRMAPAADG